MTKLDEVDSGRGPQEERLGPVRKRKTAVSLKAGAARARASALLKASTSQKAGPSEPQAGPSHAADDEELDDDVLIEMLGQPQEEYEAAARAEEEADAEAAF